MCGIAGVFAYRAEAPPVDEQELLRIREHMIRRGPDGAGLWISDDRRVGLAHRRLAIIDLSEAAGQPMWNAERTLCVTYNGEIYNYRALRAQLEARGCVFRSNSDTEVLLHLYAEHGAEMVHKLRGMFAFGIWDARGHTLFIARDPFGIKPLYYADDGATLRFASQVKALRAGGAIGEEPEPAGAAGFLLWGYVPEPFTLYRGIVALPAGSHLTLQHDSKPMALAYFSVRDELVQAQLEARPFAERDREELGEKLRDTVRHHLVSDVPMGVFLSAGVDSTLLASLASEEPNAPRSAVTLGFDVLRGAAQDEAPLAQRTAAALGMRHRLSWIAKGDFEESCDAILEAMDQPTTDGINSWFVCREASRAGLKVALSGLGGDELFAGYPSFRDVPRLRRWLRPTRFAPFLGCLARIAVAPAVSAFTSPKFASLLEYGGTVAGAYLLRRALFLPWELRRVFDPVTMHVGLERLGTLASLEDTVRGIDGDRARVTALELAWYQRNQLLRDTDWAGMTHSVEVRTPLIDATLFRALAPWIVSGRGPSKVDAAAAPRRAVSREIVERPKSGFAPPTRDWTIARGTRRDAPLNRGLRDWARCVLPVQPTPFRVLMLVSDAYGRHGGIAKFNRDFISAVAAMGNCAEVVVVPRLVSAPLEPIPQKVKFVTGAANSKLRFVWAALWASFRGPFDLVVAGHINLAALGTVLASVRGARAALVIHGIDAWSRHKSALVRASLPRLDRIVGVSKLTLARFAAWSSADPKRFQLLPNCVDLTRFTPGPRPAALAGKLGLEHRTVIMTLGRLAQDVPSKGFDEVIEALPALIGRVPDIAYLICGDGPDRGRLEAKANALGVRGRVVFAGFVREEEKIEYYRLADAYVMPSSGEGFGIVLLEALACGLPVLGSAVDGSREALLDGTVGALADPRNRSEIVNGITRLLACQKRVPEAIGHYSLDAFRGRVDRIVSEALAGQ